MACLATSALERFTSGKDHFDTKRSMSSTGAKELPSFTFSLGLSSADMGSGRKSVVGSVPFKCQRRASGTYKICRWLLALREFYFQFIQCTNVAQGKEETYATVLGYGLWATRGRCPWQANNLERHVRQSRGHEQHYVHRELSFNVFGNSTYLRATLPIVVRKGVEAESGQIKPRRLYFRSGLDRRASGNCSTRFIASGVAVYHREDMYSVRAIRMRTGRCSFSTRRHRQWPD